MKSSFLNLTCHVFFDLLVFRGTTHDGRTWGVEQTKNSGDTSWYVTVGDIFVGCKDELIDALNLVPDMDVNS